MLRESLKIVKDCYKSVKIEELVKIVDGFEYISFDLYDTLIKRYVCEPEDIFRVVEKIYSERFGKIAEDFAEKRKQAEVVARRESVYEEVTLKEIYKYIEIENAERFMELELETEREMSHVDPDVKKIFDFCCANDKKVFIISDIYLPREFIDSLLKKEGLNSNSGVYISSELRCTKYSGRLFQYAMEKEKIIPDKWVHIGDSYQNDFKSPHRFGISSYKIRKYRSTPIAAFRLRKKSLELSCLSCFCEKQAEKTEYFKWGYKNFGVFLWQFVKWIGDQVEKQNIKKIYFFSRDGYIMKKAFDKLYQKADYESYYLEVSRRSLRVPILWMNCELKTYLDMISPSERISLTSVFEGAGLDITAYHDILQKYGFTEESVLYRSTIFDNVDFAQLFEEIKPDIIRNSKEEYTALKEYLKQQNIQGKMAIVDIGWSGGMQRYLIQTLKTLGVECEIYGFYTGIVEYVVRNTRILPMNMKGYLFDFHNNLHDTDVRAPFVGLFETLFLEQRGSVEKYILSGDVYTAKRYQYEYDTPEGMLVDEKKCVREIQEGALQFIDDICNISFLCTRKIAPLKAFRGILKTGNRPEKKDIEMFSMFRFFDEGECNYLSEYKGLFFYIFHPKQFKNDFLKCRWKTGFFKQMIKIPFPYEKIYYFLKSRG